MRKPISPRAGTRYSTRTQPVPWLTICSIRPLRRASSCVVTPRKSSGMSIASRSTGSCSLPSISRVTTCGLPTVSSKPSRRIVSTSTASWSSPRPCTSQVSGRSVSSTRIDTLPTSSCSSRSCTCRAVSRVPDWPASGEVLMPIVMPSAGSSIAIGGSGLGILRVGDRLADRDLRDARDRDDLPRPGLVGVDAPQALRDVELGDGGALDGAVAPAPRHGAPLRSVPLWTRQSASRPTYGDASRLVTSAWSPWPSSYSGAGTCSTSRSSSGRRSVPSGPASSRRPARLGVRVDDRELDLLLVGVEVEEQLVDLVHHLRDCARRAGPPCSPRGSRAAGARAPCGARSASAAAGPSEASTSRSTPSTIVRPRSTSPPKSAWPGVSTMLSFTSP